MRPLSQIVLPGRVRAIECEGSSPIQTVSIPRLRRTLAMFALSASVLLAVGLPGSAHESGNGMSSANLRIQPYNYNSTWQTPMNSAVSNWDSHGKVSITKSSIYASYIQAASYAETWYVLYTKLSSNSFRIRLNSRTISRDAGTFSYWVQSVLCHELGHSLNLAHNSVELPIMRQSRNRDTIRTRQGHDTNDVTSYY